MKFVCSQVLIALICCLYIADSTPVIESENLSEPKIPKPDELFEGDIAGIEKNERGAYQIPTKNVGLWSKGIVPYLIDPYSNFYSSEILTIKQALKQIEDSTRVYGSRVVRFDEIYESQTYRYSNYIRVIRGIGCYSYVGRQKNEKYQYLSLGFGCVTIGIIQHEFMHALGFFHEQSRPDRDDYVTIYYQNIQQGQEINFQRYTWNIVGLREFPYDYSSLMHYGTYEFSGNGLPTIVPKQLGVTIGQRIGLSTQDAAEIIAVYSSGKRSIFMGLEIMFISLSTWIISRVF